MHEWKKMLKHFNRSSYEHQSKLWEKDTSPLNAKEKKFAKRKKVCTWFKLETYLKWNYVVGYTCTRVWPPC